MLATPSQLQLYRRGHSHKRSAAISGDFDLEFFKQPPITQVSLNNSTLNTNPFSTPILYTQNSKESQALTITEPNSTDYELNKNQFHEKQDLKKIMMISTPSPKRHTRLNSWAHTLIKSKKKDKGHNSCSNETTPKVKHQSFTKLNPSQSKPLQRYQIPEAIIDLDLASGIYRDPSTKSPIEEIQHRRTESAPELEDFLKYKVFNTSSSSQKPSRKNSAIFEEDEDDETYYGMNFNTSSATNLHLKKNPSLNSLNSSNSTTLLPPSKPSVTPTIQLTPNSLKSTSRRSNASAARYQSYYNNLMQGSALKSSDSLSQLTNGSSSLHNRSSYSSFRYAPAPSSDSSTSINSSVSNSPSRFKFESQIYDILPSGNNQPLKPHKKTNSLVNVMKKIRSTKSRDSMDSEYEGDSTLTTFNLGEPGPAVDLTELKVNEKKKIEVTPKRRRFLGWRKK